MNNPPSIKPTLQESVQSAINKSGFVLEMKVARLLKENDLTPYQSVYCTNEKLDIEREVDLVATKIAVTCNDQAFFKISLVIQCKWSKNIPWVVFLNNLDQTGNDGLLKLLFTNNNRSFITGLSNDVANRLAVLSKSPSKIGYGMTSGIFDNGNEHGKSNRENKKDVAYDAYRSVISGSLGVLKLAQEDMKMGFSRNLVHMVIPIIIVDGNLFESSLDNGGSVQVNSADSSMVSYNGTHYSMVRIYNLSGFESAINAINSDIEIILTAVRGNGVKYAANTTIGIVNRI